MKIPPADTILYEITVKHVFSGHSKEIKKIGFQV